jgi:hypothetical protein
VTATDSCDAKEDLGNMGLKKMALLGSVAAALAYAENTATSAEKGAAGSVFFEKNVVPRLAENGCPMCHAVGYVQPNVLVYEELLPYLAMGDAPEKTPVIRKIANLRAIRPDLPTHPGGQRCETVKSEPCRTIVEWWHVEFGSVSSAPGGDR